MKASNESIVRGIKSAVRRLRAGQRGQTIVVTATAVTALLATAGLVIDVASAYSAYQMLLGATQAAALAGASALYPNGTASEAIAAAKQYSAVSGNLNSASNLTNVTMVAGYPQVECLTSVGIPCSASPADANAVAVSESATVPTTFIRVLGITSVPITVTATAAGRTGYNGPYNVAIILDTTESMNDKDSDSQCNSTRLSCALAGIRVLLSTLWPCAAGLPSCGAASAGNVANPVDEAGLLVFPGLASASQASDDYTCPTTNPTTTTYNNAPAYVIVPFSSDYRTSDTAGSLNSASDMVVAVGGGSCSGVAAPGGQRTFYAGVIDAAQAQLVAEARPNTKNVMILLSDGNANAPSDKMNGTATSYPATQECHQAITEAQNATAAGTTVYAVAYGAESSGCPTDTSPSITPCQTMEQIASTAQTFFSDYTATGGSSSCVSAARPTSNLNQIFQEIAEDLTVARLIPNNTQ